MQYCDPFISYYLKFASNISTGFRRASGNVHPRADGHRQAVLCQRGRRQDQCQDCQKVGHRPGQEVRHGRTWP